MQTARLVVTLESDQSWLAVKEKGKGEQREREKERVVPKLSPCHSIVMVTIRHLPLRRNPRLVEVALITWQVGGSCGMSYIAKSRTCTPSRQPSAQLMGELASLKESNASVEMRSERKTRATEVLGVWVENRGGSGR
jgi:hypothetical protein